MSDCNGNSIIQPIVQDLNALGERIGKAIDSATADRDVQLLEGALLALAETRARLQGKTPVTQVSATIIPLHP